MRNYPVRWIVIGYMMSQILSNWQTPYKYNGLENLSCSEWRDISRDLVPVFAKIPVSCNDDDQVSIQYNIYWGLHCCAFLVKKNAHLTKREHRSLLLCGILRAYSASGRIQKWLVNLERQLERGMPTAA